MSAPVQPARRGLYVVAVIDNAAKDEARRMVIIAATRDDAAFIARIRGAAENMKSPRILQLTPYFGAE
jgi:hypothetical protein